MHEHGAGPASKRRRRLHAVLGLTLSLAIFFALSETGIRAYWTWRKLSFFGCQNQIFLVFHRQLEVVLNTPVERGDGVFDVLLLGGSVLHPEFATIDRQLGEQIETRIDGPVRVHNVSGTGHVSLDSFYKYRHLTDKSFDLVLVYHGVNEVRANNCPDELYRDDYSHYAWYADLNAFERAPGARWLASPYTFGMLWRRGTAVLGLRAYQPKNLSAGDPAWVQHGAHIKTQKAFDRNLSAIVELAKQKNQTLVLMTFAYYNPPQFPDAWYPTRIWGRPANVEKGIRAHNDVVSRLVQTNPELIFVDQNRLIPKEKAYFRDVCHLSEQGSERFVQNVMGVLEGQKILQ